MTTSKAIDTSEFRWRVGGGGATCHIFSYKEGQWLIVLKKDSSVAMEKQLTKLLIWPAHF